MQREIIIKREEAVSGRRDAKPALAMQSQRKHRRQYAVLCSEKTASKRARTESLMGQISHEILDKTQIYKTYV